MKLCFNGAALVRARRGWLRRKGWLTEARFNGAALVRARRVLCKPARHRRLAGLQRSRARASAERQMSARMLIARTCFNGAALVRARRARQAARSGCDWDALQRSRARASAESRWTSTRHDRRQIASTEPRSCERGEGIPRPCACSRTGRFNGAALVRARRARQRRDAPARRSCFNGAALVRARRAPWPTDSSSSPSGFNGAALVRARRARHDHHQFRLGSASTEPRSCERGESDPRIRCLRSAMLQRSRARASAERWPRAGSSLRSPGFNGAALVRARRVARRACGRKWRRGFNGAALVRARRGRTCTCRSRIRRWASTEPRSCERGEVERRGYEVCIPGCFNGAALVRARRALRGRTVVPRRKASTEPRSCERGEQELRDAGETASALQRSRARASAESLGRDWRRFPSCKLQRSRARASAERRLRHPRRSDWKMASTEPRSCERGESQARSSSIRSTDCFNGAALVRARRGVVERNVRPRHIASTEPRSCERGERQRPAHLRQPDHASTEPRSCERGEGAGDPVHAGAQGFNGAALVRARRAAVGRSECAGPEASTEPRSCERGEGDGAGDGGVDVAASTEPRSCERGEPRHLPQGSHGGCASTEPRSCERGELQRKRSPVSCLMLQRSRARASAERAVYQHAGVPHAGFNGAALVRARRDGRGRGCARRPQASTEPRSCERGEVRICCHFQHHLVELQRSRARASAERLNGGKEMPAAVKLQRSRARASAESLRSPSGLMTRFSLQRSRARASAERRDGGQPAGSSGAASTEPRSCERGETCDGTLRVLTDEASTEPRSCERGEIRLRDR